MAQRYDPDWDLPSADGSTRTVRRRAYVDSGRAGIRTREPLTGLAIFKTAAFVRSATLPRRVYLRKLSDPAVEGAPSCR